MKFIDFFAGIGGFRRGMELAGHECVGFCEFDKFAVASYTSMHLITDEQRGTLTEMPIKQRQKEILKDEYRNGEWYADDIRRVCAKDIPAADCWTFGAPCQDFSIAGKRAGLDGDRSSLIREVFRLLEEQKEQDRPEWIIYENVKGMLSSNRGLDYLSILSEMDRLGYDIEWKNINSKWFVPQNRGRIYTIGHLRRFGSRKVFPIEGTGGENSISIIGHKDGYRRNTQVFYPDGITETLDAGEGGGRGHHVALPCFVDMNYGAGIKTTEISRTLQARYNKGINNHSGETSGVAITVLTPDRENKRQNGRRFKENGDPMFTLTAQDRHGVVVAIDDTYGFGGTRIYEDAFPTLRSGRNGLKCGVGIIDPQGRNTNYGNGIYVEMPEGFIVYAIWYEKEQCYITIRKLTPKECFRLQGWTDDYFEKAAFVNSDSQLYKQAGNGVTVDVAEAIGDKINEYKKQRIPHHARHDTAEQAGYRHKEQTRFGI